MKIYNVNYCNNQSFRAIKLTAEETKLAEKIVQDISGKKNVSLPKMDSNLFKIFYKHVENEAELKSGKYYLYDEVISELLLLFSETLKEIKENGGILQTIISKLNEYKPSKNAIKPEYLNKSLDENIFPEERKTTKKIDLITEADLPIPESAEVREKHRKTLISLIDSADITPIVKDRMTKLMNGKSAHAIAREEKVSLTTVELSKKRATLEMQKKSGIIPKEVYDKAKEIKKELGLSISAETLIDPLIKHPALIYLKTELLKNKFDRILSLLKCDHKAAENLIISNVNILGSKTETLERNLENFAEMFDITEEESARVVLKSPYLLGKPANRLKDNMNEIASAAGKSYDEIKATVIKQPKMLFYSPETIIRKKNVRLYYNNLTNNSNKDFSFISLCQTNYNYWYNTTLAYILTGKRILKDRIKGIEELIDYIKSLDKNSVYTYNIPDGEIASDLVKHAKQLSKELLGKNVFKFNIVSDFDAQKKQLAVLFGLSDEKIADFTKKNPFILYHPVQTIEKHLQEFARSLYITKDKALEMALEDTDIFVYPPEVIKKKGISIPESGSRKKERRYYYKKLTNDKYKSVSAFGVYSTDYNRLCEATLSYILTGRDIQKCGEDARKEIVDHIKSLNKNSVCIYNIPEGEVVSDLIRYAEQLSEELLGKNVFKFNIVSDFEAQKKQLAEHFGLSDEKIAEFAKENPFILYWPIQVIENRVQEFANFLGITKAKAFEAAQKDADILIYPTEIIKGKILSAIEKLGGVDNEFINRLIEEPDFYTKLDKLCKKKALKEYYCKLINKKFNKMSVFYLLKNHVDSQLCNGILAYIIAGQKSMIADEKHRGYKGNSLVEIIQSMQEPVYEYNIPDGEVVEEFIQYAENLSTQIHGKNIFKFNVIKEEN